MSDFTDTPEEELRRILLTLDGQGVSRKTQALASLLEREYRRGFVDGRIVGENYDPSH